MRRQLNPYLLSLVATAAALLLRAALEPWLGPNRPFVTLYAAIALATWLGGLWPGLLATVVGAAVADRWFVGHEGALAAGVEHFVGFAAYGFSASIIIALGVAARRSRARLEHESAQRLNAERATQAVLAEQSAQRQFLETLLDNASICVAVLTGPDLRITFANRAYQALAPGVAMLGRPYAEVFPEAAAHGSVAVKLRVLETGTPSEEYGIPVPLPGYPDGAWDHRIVRMPPGPDGGPSSVLVVKWNVTEREQALRELRESRGNFNQLADAMPQLVWTARADGVVDYYNARRSKYHGGDDLPRNWELLVHPDDRRATWQAWSEASATGRPYEMEHRILMADGSHRWHLSRALPAYDDDGRITKWFGTATDVDRLKRVETALVEASESLSHERERLSLALRAAHMGVYEWNLRSDAVWWSPEIYSVYGVDPASFAPTIASFSALIHADDREELWRRLDGCIERREVFMHEFRIVRPGGEMRWVVNRSQVGLGADGRPERVTGVAFDITERKRAEHLLLDADRRKDEFIATLAHELRNPLAPIRNAVRLLGGSGNVTADPAWAHDVIERQVGHMARLLDDLLDISRISLGRVELQRSRVTLASVVELAVETSHPVIERAHHAFEVDIPAQPVWLEVDAVRLAQVLSNLLNNAAKYTEPGGHLRLRASCEHDEVCISVVDDGIGIAPDMLPRVFEMFSQAEPAIERSQGGLGIGLSLARGLCEAMGGTMDARSEGPGRGSEFVVRLPLPEQPAPASSAASEPAAEPENANGLRVVVADDLRDSADSLAMLLGSYGHDVRTAYDGAEACATAREFRPDAVLLDLGMPRLNGYEACTQIRAESWGTDVLIVALTGWGEEETRRRTCATGFDLHLVKPVDIDALLEVLASRRPRAGSQVPLPLFEESASPAVLDRR